MGEQLKQLFQNLPDIVPSAGLAGMVSRRIQKEEAEKLRRQLWFSRLAALASVAAAALAIMTFGNELVHSEFAKMLSLSFSDLNIIAGNWGDYLQSLMETFPTLTVIGLLIPLFALFISASSYASLNEHRHKYI